MKFLSFFIFLFVFLWKDLFAQNIQVNFPVLEEYLRRNQIVGSENSSSFMFRPFSLNETLFEDGFVYAESIFKEKKENFFSPDVKLLPIYSSTLLSFGNPYPEVSKFVMSKGFQQYFTAGLYSSIGPLSIQIQPEFIYSQNLDYLIGISKSNNTEYLERFGETTFRRILPGQSSLRINFGVFSIGGSTENVWWGPGQFNSLLFSNNAFGFRHITFNTRKPAKTFLGNFEGQLIVGKLEGADEEIISNMTLKDDWRYLNGFTFSYQPKLIQGLFIGISRVFQQYNSQKGQSFNDYFPIFEAFQKDRLVKDPSNSIGFDQLGVSQQLTGSVRFVNSHAKAELYFEYGRRDHALNWREFTLNPEHARAYLVGFNKLFALSSDSFFQLRAEVLQQQESINILIRYPGTGGSLNWGGHGWIPHGFTHRGQMLGPGVGPSSNVQTLEGVWVKGFKKLGIKFERLNRHQDIYQKNFLDPSEQGRWIDFSARLLADWKWSNFIVSSNLNFVNSLNEQWKLSSKSSHDFPMGKNHFSFHTQISLIYLMKFNKN